MEDSGRSPQAGRAAAAGAVEPSCTVSSKAGIPNADAIAASLSDEAIIVAFGWFSFGAKASVTSNPPHANMRARQAALDELLAAKIITHEHEYQKRYGIDRHHFKGTHAVMDMLGTKRGQAVLASAIEAQRAATAETGAVADESAVAESQTPNSSGDRV